MNKWLTRGSLAVIGFLILLPIVLAGVNAFSRDGSFTLQNFSTVLLDARQLGLLMNSLAVALGSALLALVIGVPFAILISRTQFFGRQIFALFGLAPICFSPLIFAIAWSGFAKVQGVTGAILIYSLCYFPLVWILTARALERIDRRIEESARLLGGWRAAWRIQFPLIAPSALMGALLVFIFSIADFSVPDYLSSVGQKFDVYAEEIFLRWRQESRTGEAIVASIPPMILISMALWAILILKRRNESIQFSGAIEPTRVTIQSTAPLLFCVAIAGSSVCIPLYELFREAGGLESYRIAFAAAQTDLVHSVVYSLGAALAGILLWGLPALYSARARSRNAVDFLALLPLSVPAVLLAVGMIRAWNRFDLVYGTPIIVMMVYWIRFSAFPYFAMQSAFMSQGEVSRESAAVLGVPWGARLFQLTLRPAIPALASGALLLFVFSMREVDSVALIPEANSTVMFRIYNYLHYGRDSLIAALCLISFGLIALPIALYTIYFSKFESHESAN